MSKEAMKLALEALNLIDLEFVCDGAHHAKKDRHELGDDCPVTARYQLAIKALEEALAKQEQGEPVACERCKQLEEQAYDLLGQLKVANIKLAYATPQQPVIDKSAAIRIATALGWTPPKQEQIEKPFYKVEGPLHVVCQCDKCKAKQEQGEPVAMRYDFDGYGYKYIDSGSGSDWQTRIKDAESVYSKPQQRKPLTDEQIGMAFRKVFSVGGVVFTNGATEFARAIEAAHGIKENT